MKRVFVEAFHGDFEGMVPCGIPFACITNGNAARRQSRFAPDASRFRISQTTHRPALSDRALGLCPSDGPNVCRPSRAGMVGGCGDRALVLAASVARAGVHGKQGIACCGAGRGRHRRASRPLGPQETRQRTNAPRDRRRPDALVRPTDSFVRGAYRGALSHLRLLWHSCRFIGIGGC